MMNIKQSSRCSHSASISNLKSLINITWVWEKINGKNHGPSECCFVFALSTFDEKTIVINAWFGRFSLTNNH